MIRLLSRRRWARALRVLALLVVAAAAGAQPAAPRLEITAPDELAADRARIERYDTARLASIVQLVGLDDPGEPIHVVLARETSSAAQRVGPNIAGYALGRAGLVVIFPGRSPVYPDDSIDDVLRHEVAHVLIDRAVGGHPVPRWYHEGLAMAAEQELGIEDRTRLVYELALSAPVAMSDLDRLFGGGPAEMSRAYTLAGAFVRDLLAEHGRGLPRRLHPRLAAGVPFNQAFAETTGIRLDDAERAFWQRQRLWTTWIPFLTSTSALWMVVTLLVLLAIRRRRLKSAAIHARWKDEEALYERPDPPPPPVERVH